jgi:multiple sugar transport system permease protein
MQHARRKPIYSGKWGNLLSGLLWTAPWWLGFLLFLAVPMGVSLYISFCDYPLLQPPVFIGAANYRALAFDPDFHKVVGNTLLYAALAVPAGTVVAILLAVLLNQNVRGQALFRACIFLPTIVPLVAVGVVWMWMLNPEFGLVNTGLGIVDLEGPEWLNQPHWAMASLVLISLWLVGSPVVIYLAGLQDIPGELYEAAKLDGASQVRRFWHVTLPGLSPVILFNVIIAIITALQIFALPYVMWRTQKGPEGATYFYIMYLFDNAFRYLKMGYASAMAWIQLLIILALTGVVFLVSRRAVHYRGV